MTEWLHFRFSLSCIGEGNGNPLQYSCLENPMDGGAWWAAVHGVAQSRTWLSDFTFAFHLHALEKEVATQSSVLAWRIPGTGEPGGLPSMGLHRVRHDWSNLAAAAAAAVFYSMFPKLRLCDVSLWLKSGYAFLAGIAYKWYCPLEGRSYYYTPTNYWASQVAQR